LIGATSSRATQREEVQVEGEHFLLPRAAPGNSRNPRARDFSTSLVPNRQSACHNHLVENMGDMYFAASLPERSWSTQGELRECSMNRKGVFREGSTAC
jgi:hypothetical protein